MKQIFLSLLFAVFAFGANAQEDLYGYRTDTLGASDTVYFYVGGTNTASGAAAIREYGALSIVLVSDSISGSTNGTPIIQYCTDATGTNWYTQASLTAINGAAQQSQITEDAVFLARKARVRVISPSGAQATRLRMHYSFKGAN